MRMVIKVGTSTLAHASGRLNIRRSEALCRVLSDVKNAGHEIILVSSGAIGLGTGKMNLKERPQDMAGRQAAAAVGQCELMYQYDRLFGHYSHTVAQMLLTADDFSNPERRTHLENTLFRLLELGILPIINENDTVATDEISVGDNDTLSALVATCAQAELLVILSDIEGLYSADPHDHPDAQLIHRVEALTPEILALGGGSASSLGTGGMATKLRAAQIVTAAGIDLVIATGQNPEILYDIVDGKDVGTRFIAAK